jgi:hypothetical protein
MTGVYTPSMVNHLRKSRDGDPKILKLETSWPPRPAIVGKEERAMVGEGGRKRVEDMEVEVKVPFRITKESVDLAQGRVYPLVTASEAPILEVNFFEVTSLKRCPEPIKTAPVDISITLVSCSINLVEVSEGNPLFPAAGFWAINSLKKSFLRAYAVGP